MCGIAPLRMQPGGTRVTNPWLPLGPLPVTASKQQPQQHTKPAEWPHKFQPGSDWAIVTRSDASPGEALPYCTLAEYDNQDKELVKEEVKNLLGNYLDGNYQSNGGGLRGLPKHKTSPWRPSSRNCPLGTSVWNGLNWGTPHP